MYDLMLGYNKLIKKSVTRVALELFSFKFLSFKKICRPLQVLQAKERMLRD